MVGVNLPLKNLGLETAVDNNRRFQGLNRLYGTDGVTKIQQSHVVVVGVGGVGSWAAEALARSGVGQITLIDMDHVAESNINRQIHALTSTLGQSKVLAMRERILQINPGCQVNIIDDFVTSDNWSQLLPVHVDGVIDACDDARAKVTIAASAIDPTQPFFEFITVGAAGGKKMAHLVSVDDLSRATHDPLLAKLRYTLRRKHRASREKKAIGIACVFSREPIVLPTLCDGENLIDGGLNCHGYGSAVSVTASFGLCAAGWVINKISAKK
jgi:tRNA threonylcarbamoyladenosine dehydratase